MLGIWLWLHKPTRSREETNAVLAEWRKFHGCCVAGDAFFWPEMCSHAFWPAIATTDTHKLFSARTMPWKQPIRWLSFFFLSSLPPPCDTRFVRLYVLCSLLHLISLNLFGISPFSLSAPPRRVAFATPKHSDAFCLSDTRRFSTDAHRGSI